MGSFCLLLLALSCRFLRAYADTRWQMFSAALSYTEVLLSFLFLDFPVIAPLCILYVCLPGELWVMQCCEHCATAEDKCFLPNPDKASKCRQKLPLDWRFSSSLCSLLADVWVHLNASSVTAFTSSCSEQRTASVWPPEGWPQGVCLLTDGTREETVHLGHNSVSHSITAHTVQ